MNLQDILSDEPEVVAEAQEVEAQAEQPQIEGQAPEPAAEQPEPAVFEGKATLEERRKRQEAEAELAELRRWRESVEAASQAAQYAAEPVDYEPDPLQVAQQSAAHVAKEIASEMINRSRYEDFDTMRAKFLDMARENPTIANKCLQDPDPWGAAYRMAKNHEQMEQLGATDLTTLRAQIEEQVRKEYEAKQKPQFPQSLAGGQSSVSAVAGRPALKSLDDILRGT
jgi:hypothetical protein